MRTLAVCDATSSPRWASSCRSFPRSRWARSRGRPAWAARLARIGLDVAASGAGQDTAETLAAARAAAPHLPLKARVADAGALDGMAALIVETAGPGPRRALPPGTRRGSGGRGRRRRARLSRRPRTSPAWPLRAPARAPPRRSGWPRRPGSSACPRDVAEAKLAALVEGVRQARLWLAKEQFDRDDPGPSWGPRGYVT